MDLLTSLYAVAILLICVLLSVFLYVTVWIAVIHARYDHLPGPKRSSFYFGHLALLAKCRLDYTDISRDDVTGKLKPLLTECSIEWARIYGNTYVIYILHRPFVFTRSPNITRELLVNSDPHVIPKSKVFTIEHIYGYRYMGEGLATARDHDAWYLRRKAIDPVFHRNQLRHSVDAFNTTGDRFIEKLNGYAESGETFQLSPILNLTTLDVIMKTMFSIDSAKLDSDFHKQATDFTEDSFKAFQLSVQPLAWLNPLVFRRQQETKQLLQSFRKIGAELIAVRKSAIVRGDDVPQDFLTVMVQASLEASVGYTEDIMVDEFVTMVIAGMETSANTLSFVFMELGRRPDLVKRLVAEIDDVVGEKAFISNEDMTRLPFTTTLIKETLRYYPPVADIFRVLKKEVVLDGHRIPADTEFIFNILAANRNEEFLEGAEEFNPDRFDHSQDNRVPLCSFMTFSLGPRNCIGQVFAQMEMKVMLAKFFQRYEFILDESERFELGQKATLYPLSGLMGAVRVRSC